MIAPLEARQGRILKLRLELGLGGLDRVEHWADEQITRHDEPPYELLELALARSLNEHDVEKLLETVVGSDIEMSDLVAALAPVDPQALTLEELLGLLGRASDIFCTAFLLQPAGEADASWLALYDTSELRDAFFVMESGGLTVEQVRTLASNHFRKLREIAISSGASA